MFYITIFLFALALYFGISGFRRHDKDRKVFGFTFFIAGLGTVIILLFAFSALETTL